MEPHLHEAYLRQVLDAHRSSDEVVDPSRAVSPPSWDWTSSENTPGTEGTVTLWAGDKQIEEGELRRHAVAYTVARGTYS